MVRTKKTLFFSILPRAVSIVYSSISDAVLDKMRIEDNYAQVYNENNIVALVKMAEFASMGEGSSTIYQNMAMLMGLKISDGKFFEFVKMFQQHRRRAHNEKDKAVLVETFFDTIFIMGLKDYQPLEKELDTIFGSKVWPTADECIAKFSTMITVKNSMSTDKERKAGMVEANKAKIEDARRGALTTFVAKYTRDNGGGKLPFVCFNCGEAAGHAATDCPLAKKHGPSKCKYCHGRHSTKVHHSHFPDAKKPAANGDDDDDVLTKLKGLTTKQLKTVRAHLAGVGTGAKVDKTGVVSGRSGLDRAGSGGAAKAAERDKKRQAAAKEDSEGDDYWQEDDEDSDDE